MLEVCFNDSVKASLAIAQHCGNEIGGASSIAFVSDQKGLSAFLAKQKAIREYKKRAARLQKQAVPLGGIREDLVGISFSLSVGEIKSPIVLGECPRKEALRALFCFDRYHEQENMEEELEHFWKLCIEDLGKLASCPKQIRVWLDATPDAQCGLLFVADLLKDSETELYVVELPEKIEREDHCPIEYRGWGEIEPQLFGTFLDREKQLTKQEINRLAARWRQLQEENALLRVMEHGAVVSADERYYDDLIRNEFPHQTCRVVEIIGNALGRQKIPTSDVWIAKRIQTMIDRGELALCDNGEQGFYSAMVRRAE